MRIRVEGGQPLNGVYTPAGSSNAAIHLLAAALMTDQPVTLHNVPNTANTQAMVALARLLGADASEASGIVTLHTPQIIRRALTPDETQGFVGALLYLAPILARRGYARLELDFAPHRIRTHLDALRDLGQDVQMIDGAIELRAAKWDYQDILLTQASVTATTMVLLLAAALGKETRIRNAACEPQIQALGELLELMGVELQGIGSNVLHIWGQRPLLGASVT
ncbi:MAG: hypothetical protein H7Y11_15790, partial [Armatimonadetes bacterium]|nr:hypothetical protein [Anaerolineae bacterium]